MINLPSARSVDAVNIMEAQKLLVLFTISVLSAHASVTDFNVGVVFDFQTVDGKMCHASISLAMEDFYSSRVAHKARLVLHYRDSREDDIEAANQALDLVDKEKVQAIIGASTSSQAAIMIDIGKNRHVPIISFSATSPSLSSPRSPYFIRTTMSDSAQVGCIAAIAKLYSWGEVIPVYENTRYGTGIVNYLVDALHTIYVRLPYRSVLPPNATDDQIIAELDILKNYTTRVFVIHMSYDLRASFLRLASQKGMMKEGFVWIITDDVADILRRNDFSIEGVIGCMPSVNSSSKLEEFTTRWRRRFSEENNDTAPLNPSIYSLQAYDTVTALALAAESIGGLKKPSLSNAMQNIRFKGLAGYFRLSNNQLIAPLFGIMNVVGNDIEQIADWSTENGISLHSNRSQVSSPENLTVTWPGKASTVPKGWEIPIEGQKLRVGVPRIGGFREFVHVDDDGSYKGFCIDVFEAVMENLNYSGKFEYHLFHKKADDNSDWTYDDLVEQVYLKEFDVVVGDVTILANRSKIVDFTLPFMASGLRIIVRVKTPLAAEEWIFMKAFNKDLWFTIPVFFLFTGFVVWTIEHRVNTAFRGPPLEQLGTTLYFIFSTVVFSHREVLVSNLTRLVVIVWVFVVLIVQSSFTANLSSLLTEKTLEPTYTDITQLLKNKQHVGYQGGSFIKDYLIRLGFDSKCLIPYNSAEEYKEALSKGPQSGGVAAIFAELPYISLFLGHYKNGFVAPGPTQPTAGFGFVFPAGSPLVSEVSREILKISEGENMQKIEKMWFQANENFFIEKIKPVPYRLPWHSYKGLFIITASVSGISWLLFYAHLCLRNRMQVPVGGIVAVPAGGGGNGGRSRGRRPEPAVVTDTMAATGVPTRVGWHPDVATQRELTRRPSRGPTRTELHPDQQP
ncbi:glutamate receptor 2.8-like [Wolffia australiana]